MSVFVCVYVCEKRQAHRHVHINDRRGREKGKMGMHVWSGVRLCDCQDMISMMYEGKRMESGGE